MRWDYTCLGLEKLDSPLSSTTDVILGSGRVANLIRRKSLVFLGRHRLVHDYLAAQRPDLLHIHFAAEARGIDRIARKLNIPYVITVHGNDVTEAPARRGLRGLIYRRQARRALQGACRVIAVSDFIASKVQDLSPGDDNVVKHSIGIKIPPLLDKCIPSYDVLFVGRLVAVKGVDQLLSAAKILADGGLKLRIAVAGAGPELEHLKGLALQHDLDVDFLGLVDSRRVGELLSQSLVFAAPSVATASGQAEGFGMVFLEAAAQQVPAVSYSSGGIREAVLDGVTGLLAPEKDTAALARNIERLVLNPDLNRQLGAAGRTRVLNEFNVVRQTHLLESIYDSCLQGAAKNNVGRCE